MSVENVFFESMEKITCESDLMLTVTTAATIKSCHLIKRKLYFMKFMKTSVFDN